MCPEMFRFFLFFLHSLSYSHNSSEKDKDRPLTAFATPNQPVTQWQTHPQWVHCIALGCNREKNRIDLIKECILCYNFERREFLGFIKFNSSMISPKTHADFCPQLSLYDFRSTAGSSTTMSLSSQRHRQKASLHPLILISRANNLSPKFFLLNSPFFKT